MQKLLRDVSDTALMVAMYRAIETRRPDALFKDPFAEKLAGERGKKIIEYIPKNFIGGWSIVIRTIIIDNFIKSCIKNGVDTVLNLGAGLDTRPYRMGLPSTLRWVEVDFPHIIKYKKKLLKKEKPNCVLLQIELDLEDQKTRQKLFKKINTDSKKILVLTEGVILYLSPQKVADLARDLGMFQNYQYWIVDYFSPEAMRHRPKGDQMNNVSFNFFPETEWFDFFKQNGWGLKDIRYLSEEGRRLKRANPLPLSVKIKTIIRAIISLQILRGEFNRFIGYAILHPVKSQEFGSKLEIQ
ncbi:MAG: SAM-dependent methyltransferase [Spirochaetia bacterium]|nr:SAM-dependent methyltransferase [Spirochaetia bacterium]